LFSWLLYRKEKKRKENLFLINKNLLCLFVLSKANLIIFKSGDY